MSIVCSHGELGGCSAKGPLLLLESPTFLGGIAEVLKSDMRVTRKQRHSAKRICVRLTTYPKNDPERGSISLQWHSDPFEFRNIQIRKVGDCDEK